ncbi:8453_t:CDS:10 [Entrophospora sp. SA101]|nr:8453_t:CDS:10 [Entrophospora sp. SA101]
MSAQIMKDNSDSVNSEEDFEEMYPYFDEELENNSESLFQLLNDNMKIYKDKRLLLTYHGNLKSTQKRRKASTKENINKNEKNSHEEMTQNNDSQSSETVNNELGIVDNFQKKLSINYDDLIKDIEINHLMLQKAADLVSEILNKGPWFSKCISWGKSFIKYGDVSYKKRGENLRGCIIDDEDVQDTLAFKRFESLATTPTYTGAVVLKDDVDNSLLTIQVYQSQRDLTRKIKRKIVKQLIVSLQSEENQIKVLTSSYFPIDLENVTLQALSPNGEKLLILRVVNDNKDKKRYVETWVRGSLKHIIDVTDIHETFGTLDWSKDGKKAVYIAERKALDVDVINNKVQALPSFENIAPGQVIFGPDSKNLIFAGYLTESRKFGIYACINRRSGIYQVQLDGSNLEYLSNKVEHARSPRLNLNQGTLVYLSNPAGGPHSCCSELRKSIIVPIVHCPSENFYDYFPGIYVDKLPQKSFIKLNDNDDEYVIFNSYWRSRRVILAINSINGKIQNLTPSGSWNLLLAENNYIIATSSLPNEFPKLYIGIIIEKHEGLKVDWTFIDQPNLEEVEPILSNISWSIIQPDETNPNLELIYLKPKNVTNDKIPLIVIPHGGPHSVSVLGVDLYNTILVSLGYAVIKGFGQDSIDALIGKIGDVEVEEVQLSTKYIIEKENLDEKNVVIMGGSHGGFISAHLIGKYPDFYKVCIMMNPVLNIGGMTPITDIPDWCFSECGIEYSLKRPSIMKPKDYSQMFNNSPIKNIDEVKTPTLLMLGQEDKRVPHYNGLNWWYYLKGKGDVDIQCKMDNSDSANSEEDFEEMYPYFDEELENNSESLFQLLNDNMKIYKDKRLLLTYHGNLKSTQKRRKASTKENINKNEKNSHEEMTQNNDSQSSETVNNELGIVDNFQKKLSINYDDLIKDIEINHLMLQKAADLVSEILNKGPWFSKCISWGKSFIKYGDVSYKKRGENLRGCIIDDEDVQVKILSFLRKEKFNVSVNFKEFIAKDIFPIIGVENEMTIRRENN